MISGQEDIEPIPEQPQSGDYIFSTGLWLGLSKSMHQKPTFGSYKQNNKDIVCLFEKPIEN